MNTKLGWASSVAKNNWAETCELIWQDSIKRAFGGSQPSFFPAIPVSKCTLKAKTKENHSLKSDHYTITPTGPPEPLIKILTLQHWRKAQHAMASWGLNIDTITTQEKYIAVATNKKSLQPPLLWVLFTQQYIIDYSQQLQEVNFSSSLAFGSALGSECGRNQLLHVRSEAGKALSSSSLICSD